MKLCYCQILQQIPETLLYNCTTIIVESGTDISSEVVTDVETRPSETMISDDLAPYDDKGCNDTIQTDVTIENKKILTVVSAVISKTQTLIRFLMTVTKPLIQTAKPNTANHLTLSIFLM